MTGVKKKTQKREGTLLAALLLSAPGPLVTGMAALTAQSATQTADFLRRTAELAALFASWWIYRKLQKQPEMDRDERVRLERHANWIVAAAMLLAGIVMLIVGVSRFFVFEVGSEPWTGLIIAILGLLTNAWFWMRYRQMVREHFDMVIAGQERLYRGKSLVDFFVVAALLAVLLIPDHPVTPYVDAGGCLFVAGYLMHNGRDMLGKTGILAEMERRG